MSEPIKEIFADIERNVLHAALVNSAREHLPIKEATEEELSDSDAIYIYIDEVPKTSLVSELVDSLHRLGYSITPTQN